MSKFEKAFELFKNKEFHISQKAEKEFYKKIQNFNFDKNNIKQSIENRLQICAEFIPKYGAEFITEFINTVKKLECPRLSLSEAIQIHNALKSKIDDWSEITQNDFDTFLKNINVNVEISKLQIKEYFASPRDLILNKLETQISEYNYKPQTFIALNKKKIIYAFIGALLATIIGGSFLYYFFENKKNDEVEKIKNDERIKNEEIKKEQQKNEETKKEQQKTDFNKVDTTRVIEGKNYIDRGNNTYEVQYKGSTICCLSSRWQFYFRRFRRLFRRYRYFQC
jgi:hypothetical protein